MNHISKQKAEVFGCINCGAFGTYDGEMACLYAHNKVKLPFVSICLKEIMKDLVKKVVEGYEQKRP